MLEVPRDDVVRDMRGAEDYAIEHNLTDGIWGGEWGDTLIRLTRRTPRVVPNHG